MGRGGAGGRAEEWRGSPLKSAERARATGPGKPWARARVRAGTGAFPARPRARARVCAHVECHVMELCQHP